MDSLNASNSRTGFSLLETLAVLAIMGILIGILGTTGIMWDRSERERASEREVRNALCVARQAALTRDTTACFRYGSDSDGRGLFSVDTAAEGLIGSTGRLARGVGFLSPSGHVAFGRDGRGVDAQPVWTNGTWEITLVRAARTNAICQVTISQFTGALEVRHDE